MRRGETVSLPRPRNNRTLKHGASVGRNDKKGKASPVRRVVIGSLFTCLIVAVVIGGRVVMQSVNEWTEIQQITIVGLDRLSREEVIAKMNVSKNSSLWSIDVDDLVGQVEAHPWIRSMTVDRVFPHALAVQIEERQPAAVLAASKKGYFLDIEGYLLPGEMAKANEALPVLAGMAPKFFHEHVDESHRRAKQGIHLASLLSEHFSGRPRVNVAHEHTTTIDLPRLRVQFGQEAEQQWQRFLVLYPSVKEMIARQSQEVDLRYSQKVILRKRTL